MQDRGNEMLMNSRRISKNEMMLVQSLRLILKNPLIVIFFMSMITIICAMLVARLPKDFSIDNINFSIDSNVMRQKQLSKSVADDDRIIIAFSDTEIFSSHVLVTIEQLTQKLSALPGVKEVISLTRARDLNSNQDLTLGEYLNRFPNSGYGLERFKQAIFSNPWYHHYLISVDGQTTAIIVKIHPLNQDQSRQLLHEIANLLKMESSFQFHLAGKSVLNLHLERYWVKYLSVLPIIIFMITLILYFTFENLSGIFIALLSLILAVVWTPGILAILGWTMNANIAMILPFIIIYAGTVIIQILTRYQNGMSPAPASSWSLLNPDDSGKRSTSKSKSKTFLSLWSGIARAVGFAGLATALVMVTFLVSDIPAIQMVGYFIPLTIGIVLLIVLTIIPALLFRMPTRLDDSNQNDSVLHALIKTFGQISLQDVSPLPVLVILILILLTGWFAMGIQTQIINYRQFNSETAPHRDHSFIEETLLGTHSFEISLHSEKSGSILSPQNLAVIESLTEFLRQINGIDKVFSITDFAPTRQAEPEARDLVDKNLRSARIIAFTTENDISNIHQLLSKVRSFITAAFDDTPIQIKITGNLLEEAQQVHLIMQESRKMLMVISVAAFILMMTLFRSVILAIIGLIPGLFVIATNLGIAGFFQMPLNPLNLLVLAIAIGLTLNDTFYFLYFYKEAKKSGLHTEEAIIETLSITGKATILKTFILSTSFLVLLAANFTPVRDIGILIPVSLINALIGNLIFLPLFIHIFKPVKTRLKFTNDHQPIWIDLTFKRESYPEHTISLNPVQQNKKNYNFHL